MAEGHDRFEWVAKAAKAGLVATMVLLVLSLFAAAAMTVTAMVEDPRWTVVAAGALTVVAIVVAGICAVAAYGVVRLIMSTEEASSNLAGRLDRVESLLTNQAESVRRLTELGALSDQAKSCIFREREIEAVREAFHENLMRQDQRAAEVLVDTMEQRLGYAEEAARMREEMASTRAATLEEKIDAAVKRIQSIIDRHDWSAAIRESQRLLRLFPQNPKVSSLPERIEAGRTKHKRDLLQAYGEAVARNDVDHSIDLLKELDLYLTPQEAAALHDSARGVFREKLHNLGVQFAISVTERQWARAVDCGEQIMRDFPNTRMAQEVREKMDLLRSRAGRNLDG